MSTVSRPVAVLIALAIISSTGVLLSPEASAAQSAKPKLPWQGPPVRVEPGRLVVTFAGETAAPRKRAIHTDVGARLTGRSRAADIDVVELPPDLPPLAAIRRYEADPSVVAAELDRVAVPTEFPDDDHFAMQWGLRNVGQEHPTTDLGLSAEPIGQGSIDADVDANEAWDATTTGDDVVVAVIDTGVDIDHPDLAGSMWVNPVEQSGLPDVDDDDNGYVDDIHGWDFQGNDPDPSPASGLSQSHGTHVAGIVAAERANGIGVAGVCGACRIMGLRFDLTLGQEVEAIEYAIENGADIINMSYSSPVWSPAERAAIQAAGEAGALTVAAAGNASADNDIPFYPADGVFAPGFPASYGLPTILSVAASDDQDEYGVQSQCSEMFKDWQCAFTSWGRDSVDVAAPGTDIVSTVRSGGDIGDGRYHVLDGTSMAAPLVAGIAGSVKHEHPAYGPLDLKNAVMNSVDHPSKLKLRTAWADVVGVSRFPIDGTFTRTQGRVNALAALTAPITNATPLTDGNIDGAKSMAKSVKGRVAWPADVNDVYEKRLRGGRRFRIRLDGSVGKDFDLWVWTPKAKEIHQFTTGCFRRGGSCPALKAISADIDADEQVTFTVKKTGVYVIQVQGWYSGGKYTLSVRRL